MNIFYINIINLMEKQKLILDLIFKNILTTNNNTEIIDNYFIEIINNSINQYKYIFKNNNINILNNILNIFEEKYLKNNILINENSKIDLIYFKMKFKKNYLQIIFNNNFKIIYIKVSDNQYYYYYKTKKRNNNKSITSCIGSYDITDDLIYFSSNLICYYKIKTIYNNNIIKNKIIDYYGNQFDQYPYIGGPIDLIYYTKKIKYYNYDISIMNINKNYNDNYKNIELDIYNNEYPYVFSINVIKYKNKIYNCKDFTNCDEINKIYNYNFINYKIYYLI